MKKFSFRSVITITLTLVVGSISFTAFHIYGNFLAKNIYEEAERNLISALELIEDQIYYTVDEHDGRIIASVVQRMNKNERVLNSYLFNGEGKLVYNFFNDRADVDFDKAELTGLKEHVEIKSFTSAEIPFSRAYIKMHNSTSCHECHAPEKEDLGYVVFDISMDETKNNISSIRIASLVSTLLIIFAIIILIIIMHYRFVRKSLKQFHTTISSINNGDLSKRLAIPETKELGLLGKDFNEMLDTLQRTQQELQAFHKQELRNKYKLATIGEMSARLAHEIRNPLTGIANATEIMAGYIQKEENKEILDEIQRQARRANNAINDLLKYSGKKTARLSMNNINQVVESVARFLTDQNIDKEINIIMELQPNIPDLRFDPEQIEDVLLNLGINSIHAVEKNGEIRFKTVYRASDSDLLIYVRDNGNGIPEENLSRIFHPFFTTRNAGTGLGLAIVKDIIDAHHGQIWAENNKDKHGGSTFTIILPLSK